MPTSLLAQVQGLPVAKREARLVFLVATPLDNASRAIQIDGKGQIFAILFDLYVSEVQKQIFFCCLQLQDLDICHCDLVGSDEVFYHKEEVSSLNRSHILEVLNEFQSANLQDLFHCLFFLSSDFLDYVRSVPITILNFYEFLSKLNNFLITLYISRQYSSLNWSYRFSDLLSSLCPSAFVLTFFLILVISIYSSCSSSKESNFRFFLLCGKTSTLLFIRAVLYEGLLPYVGRSRRFLIQESGKQNPSCQLISYIIIIKLA